MTSDLPSAAISLAAAGPARSGSTTRPTFATAARPWLIRATSRRTAGSEPSSRPPPGARTTRTIAGLGL